MGLSISRRCKLDRKDLKVSTHSRGWYFYPYKVQKVSFSTTNPDSGNFLDKKDSKVTKLEPNLPIEKFVMIDYLGSVLIQIRTLPLFVSSKGSAMPTTHLINASARSNSSLSGAFQESFQRSVRNEQATCGNFVATQTVPSSIVRQAPFSNIYPTVPPPLAQGNRCCLSAPRPW